MLLLGDFNARFGADHASSPRCLARFGIARMNENGQRLLEFCTLRDLLIANTFFSYETAAQTIAVTSPLPPYGGTR